MTLGRLEWLQINTIKSHKMSNNCSICSDLTGNSTKFLKYHCQNTNIQRGYLFPGK